MTDEIFPHPHEDASAEDPFTGPTDDLMDQSVGASPMNPLAQAQAPKRRLAIFAILGAVAILVAFLLFSGGGDTMDDIPLSAGRVDQPVIAPPPEPVTQETLDDLMQPSGGLSGAQQIDPELLEPQPGTAPGTSPPTYPQQAGPVGASGYGDIFGVPHDGAATDGRPYGSPGAGGSYGGILSDEELDRQARLDFEREQAERQLAEEQARAQARLAEEQRLRGAPTLVASAGDIGSILGSAAPPGTNRFGLAGPAGGADADFYGDAPRADDVILPGTKVGATLTSDFVSDIQGGGRVEALLNEALRASGSTILPAGTRAFGTASAQAPATGREARVVMSFDVFVTPDGQVVRGLQGHAADPETLAMSIPGKADRRFVSRVARGALSTAIDLALTSQATERRSAFETSSPRDDAINDARRRAATIINDPIGTEGSVPAAVSLESGTPFTLVFGF